MDSFIMPHAKRKANLLKSLKLHQKKQEKDRLKRVMQKTLKKVKCLRLIGLIRLNGKGI
jgi:hypothetical protein